jgi:hypothetical protein
VSTRAHRRLVVAALGWLASCNPRPRDGAPDPPQPVTAATLAFEDVRVFDGERFVERATVLVDGDTIVAIGPDLPVPPGAERIAGEGATLLPGFFDAHTHVQTAADLERALVFGVTTEIDMFTLPELAEDPRLAPWIAPAERSGLMDRISVAERPSCEPALRSVARLHEAGVRLLASTDAPNPGTTHGPSLHDELALLVHAGLSPTAALRAATADPADVFGLHDRGRIAPGKRADLVLVDGDPGRNVTATRAIRGVWKAGVALDRSAAKERVREQWVAVERAREATVPAGLAAGLVADFARGELRSEFGSGWQPSTDVIFGGGSTVALSVTDGALRIAGSIDSAGLPSAWAGAMFIPGEQPMRPVDLGSKPTLVFRARGDAPMTVMIFAEQLGMMPTMTSVETGKAWAEHTVDLRTLVADPHDITAIFFGGFFVGPSRAVTFELHLDDVRLR